MSTKIDGGFGELQISNSHFHMEGYKLKESEMLVSTLSREMACYRTTLGCER